MDPTDLIADTRRAFENAEASLGGHASGALLFICAYRRVEMEERNLTRTVIELLTFPCAGFHTYGESWLGHINHTLTGLVVA